MAAGDKEGKSDDAKDVHGEHTGPTAVVAVRNQGYDDGEDECKCEWRHGHELRLGGPETHRCNDRWGEIRQTKQCRAVAEETKVHSPEMEFGESGEDCLEGNRLKVIFVVHLEAADAVCCELGMPDCDDFRGCVREKEECSNSEAYGEHSF